MIVLAATADGFRAVARSYGLVLLLLAFEVVVAGVLAVPLASLGADVLGHEFAFRTLEPLCSGPLPAGVVLAVAALYAVAQVFLTGGVLGVLRSAQGAWTLRGLLHGSSFYCGRLLRLSALVLAGYGLLFVADAPLRHWAETRGRESASYSAGAAWTAGHGGALLLAVLFVHLVAGFARVVLVLEERSSALLALLSALAFCASNLGRAAAQYACVTLLGVGLLSALSLLDGIGEPVLLALAFIAGKIGLRLWLLGGQVSLFRLAKR